MGMKVGFGQENKGFHKGESICADSKRHAAKDASRQTLTENFEGKFSLQGVG